jgi:hypothetical protein
MSFFSRTPEPFQHPIFGRLEWQPGRRSVGSWVGRARFAPAGQEIELSIPGGRSGPEAVDALYQALSDSLPAAQPKIDALIAHACSESGVTVGRARLAGLHFFDTSPDAGEWKLIYFIGDQEIHVDGNGLEAGSAFVVE